MAKILDMPKLSPTMEEGVLSSWHKKEGDPIGVDDLRCSVPVLLGESPLEQTWRLDQVVVDADEDHVVGLHLNLLQVLAGPPRT